ncbi:centrosomal protein of 85 kDa-like [Phaenicophaeus curvirostris]|uniref:centrosomal protein of 85 kDa-like n=1 Tax=Phaenicophaeus curvirostris TaxID=33595 RepID=UPI0037F0A720
MQRLTKHLRRTWERLSCRSASAAVDVADEPDEPNEPNERNEPQEKSQDGLHSVAISGHLAKAHKHQWWKRLRIKRQSAKKSVTDHQKDDAEDDKTEGCSAWGTKGQEKMEAAAAFPKDEPISMKEDDFPILDIENEENDEDVLKDSEKESVPSDDELDNGIVPEDGRDGACSRSILERHGNGEEDSKPMAAICEAFGQTYATLGQFAAAEKKELQLNELIKLISNKSSEEKKKMEEKLKSRDRYINSLKKQCLKMSEQSKEKQRQIETLMKYLTDLRTLYDIQGQTKQLQILEEKNKQLQETTTELEMKLLEVRSQCRERELQLVCQKEKEKELVTVVRGLQQRVEKCLEDRARLPLLDKNQLLSENECLKEKNEKASKVIENQQNQIAALILDMQSMQENLLQENQVVEQMIKGLEEKERKIEQLKNIFSENQRLMEENATLKEQMRQVEDSRQPVSEKMHIADQLFKEMSHCIFELKALCSILTQKAQGEEPNLSLPPEIQSLSCSADENENYCSAESLPKKLLDVSQLRKDIDELRTMMSDRCAQDIADNCTTQ